MIAAQLIDLISREFAADEEVTFLYDDDQCESRTTDVEVKMNTMTFCNGHYEARIRGTDTWEKVADNSDEFNKVRYTSEYKLKYFEWRWIDHGTMYTDTKKVIAIG